jgi:NADH-quinone oxidoreductase subunit L
VLAGFVIGPLIFGGFFGDSIVVHPDHNVLAHLGEHYHGVWPFVLHGLMAPPFWLALAGIATAWVFFYWRPELAERAKSRLALPYRILVSKYGFDEFNEFFFAGGARGIGKALWKGGDVFFIDGLLVNGSARAVGWVSGRIRGIQTGYLYHYAFAIIIGLIVFLARFLFSG